MYSIKTTNKFEKDLILCIRRNYDVNVLNEILNALENKGIVDPQHKPYRLKGNLKGYWECHIKPDWLLIWKLDIKL